MNDCDVVVVGGGPGGAATAISCAQAGLKVVVLEGATFPRERPGETLHPGIEPLLEQLGVAEEVLAQNFPRHCGIEIEWHAERRFETYGKDDAGAWNGFQARRAEFDAILLRRAQEAGARVLQPLRANCVRVAAGRMARVETARGEIGARFVVDAAGSRHWLARQAGVAMQEYSAPLLVSYGYALGECPGRDDAPLLLAERDSWTWTARVGRKRYAWVHLDFGDAKPGRHWLPAEFAELQSLGAGKGADVTWRIAAATAGPGYFLVGDAAAVLDPASSHGVLKAIMSGIMAAHAINRVLVQGHDERLVTKAYHRWMREWFEHDVRKLNELYAIFGKTREAARADFKVLA